MSKEKRKIIFLRWLPASGKSTFAKEQLKKNPNAIRVNKDDIRSMMNNSKFSKENEELVVSVQRKAILLWMERWRDIIIDNTHISNPAHFEEILQIVVDNNESDSSHFEYEIEEKDFKTPVNVCIERDKKRENPVGAEVIKRMNKSILGWGWTTMDEELPPEFTPIKMDDAKEKCIIVDIDGTVAKMGDRIPYDYTKVHLDTPIWDVINLVKKLWEDYEIVFLSGRSEDCREETTKWLQEFFPNYGIELYMRPSWDTRKDSYVKRELLETYVLPEYYVEYILDDRNQVVKMWRESGLRCLQVANGNF